jgi:hypothetical protein
MVIPFTLIVDRSLHAGRAGSFDATEILKPLLTVDLKHVTERFRYACHFSSTVSPC